MRIYENLILTRRQGEIVGTFSHLPNSYLIGRKWTAEAVSMTLNTTEMIRPSCWPIECSEGRCWTADRCAGVGVGEDIPMRRRKKTWFCKTLSSWEEDACKLWQSRPGGGWKSIVGDSLIIIPVPRSFLSQALPSVDSIPSIDNNVSNWVSLIWFMVSERALIYCIQLQFPLKFPLGFPFFGAKAPPGRSYSGSLINIKWEGGCHYL